jgi:hypothetical protein
VHILNFALKLSEKSRSCPKRGLKGHRSGTVWPVLARYNGQIHDGQMFPVSGR